MNKFHRNFLTAFAAIGMALLLTSCKGEKFFKVEDSEWRILVIWDDGGPHVGQTVWFDSGNTVTMEDDTATYSGTWSQSGQVVSWTVDIPDRALDCKATVDRKKIEGTLTDSNGYGAIMTGDRQ